jgi:hypothetical protein
MADFCSASDGKRARPERHRCPVNGLEYGEVSARTIAQHIKHSWKWSGNGLRYYFCNDPNSDAVYFGDDDSVISKSQLRINVGVRPDDAMVCYCFGLRRPMRAATPARDFVMAQTKRTLCSETRNPSRRCLLPIFRATASLGDRSDWPGPSLVRRLRPCCTVQYALVRRWAEVNLDQTAGSARRTQATCVKRSWDRRCRLRVATHAKEITHCDGLAEA